MLCVIMLLVLSPARALFCPPRIQQTVHNGYSLTGHVITTYSFLGQREVCVEACAAHNDCNSVNFYQRKKECELNRVSHLSHPENMTAAIDSEYIDYPVVLRSLLKCLNESK